MVFSPVLISQLFTLEIFREKFCYDMGSYLEIILYYVGFQSWSSVISLQQRDFSLHLFNVTVTERNENFLEGEKNRVQRLPLYREIPTEVTLI